MLSALQSVETKKTELALSANKALEAHYDQLRFTSTVAGLVLALDLAEKAWKWAKGRSGKQDRICIENENIVYEGEFAYGKRHGTGSFQDIKGTVTHALWSDGKLIKEL